MFEYSDYTFDTFNGLIFLGIFFTAITFIFFEALKKFLDRSV